MQTINPVELRQRSQWLAFAVSFVIVTFTLGLTFLGAAENSFADDGEPRLLAMFTDYESPQRCKECHEEQYTSWEHTTHANALFDPIFRTYLEQADNPAECLACHTTGYNDETGQFVLAGVTCEACHGPYRAEHPDEESMAIAGSPEFCGECHTVTLAEWERSRHGEADVTCIDCHEVHTQKARAATATYGLCATCHQDEIKDARHQAHSEEGILCIECHLERPNEIPVNGHMLTGHSFTATRDNCEECHLEE